MENLKTKIQFLVNLYKLRNLSQAEVYAKKILRENPNVVFLYNILGLILNDLHKIDDAIDCFQRGLQINPENKDNALISLLDAIKPSISLNKIPNNLPLFRTVFLPIRSSA